MFLLKQSTAVTVVVGPFVSTSDSVSRLTGLSLTQSDITLSKNGGAMAQKNDSSSCTPTTRGYYLCTLNTTDTNTLGPMRLDAYDSSAVGSGAFHDYMVVPANVYDSFCGTDRLDVEVYTKTGFYLAADQASVTVGTVTNLTNKTGFSLSAAGIDDIWDELTSGHTTTGSTGLALANLLKIGKNKWAYNGTTFTIYDDNGTSALYQFTLDSADTPTTRTPV